jgi:hypothetical protein
MDHPTNEAWMAYLYGEADAAERERLSLHLRACARCRDEVSTWRGAMFALGASERRSRATRRVHWAGVAGWAAAAALSLSLGYVVGRGTARPSPPDVLVLRTQLEPALLASVAASMEPVVRRQAREEVDSRLRAIEEGRRVLRDNLLREVARQSGAAEARAVAASNEEMARLLVRVGAAVRSARADDREALLMLLDAMETRRLEEYATLRAHLDVLAVATGTELLRTQEDLARVVAYVRPLSVVSPTQSPDIGDERSLR